MVRRASITIKKNLEHQLKNIGILLILTISTMQVATASDTTDASRSEKIVFPVSFKDYKWDVGVISAMTMDGMQTEAKRFTLGIGLHLAYHFDESISLHAEIADYFKAFTSEEAAKDATNRMFVTSAAYDFSPERSYSLFAKAGLGYEQQIKYDTQVDSPISLMGFGFRYLFTDRVSAYVEGRWKYVLVNRETPDNSLIGSIGVDYHFGLSDEKSGLIEDAKK